MFWNRLSNNSTRSSSLRASGQCKPSCTPAVSGNSFLSVFSVLQQNTGVGRQPGAGSRVRSQYARRQVSRLRAPHRLIPLIFCISSLQSVSRIHGLKCHWQEPSVPADALELLEDLSGKRKIYDGGFIRIQYIRLLQRTLRRSGGGKRLSLSFPACRLIHVCI
jgi:hypothetical protein